MSRMESRPTARLCTMAGIQFAMIAAVAWSPWRLPATDIWTGGLPSIVITSRGSFAPMDISRSSRTTSRPAPTPPPHRRTPRPPRLRTGAHPPAHGVGDHEHRLPQANVADGAVAGAVLKALHAEAHADLALELHPARAHIHHALHANRAHLLAGGGQHQRQEVHDEPGVHARAQHPHARLAGAPVELARDVGVAKPGEGELLAAGDDALLRRDDGHELRAHGCQR